MFTKFDRHIKLIAITAITGLVFAVALSIAWAMQAPINTYSSSVLVEYGQDGQIELVKQGSNKIKVKIEDGSLDAYMAEEGLNEVLVTCEFTEELVVCGGDTHYHLTFEFGPSGAYFGPELELRIEGKYVSTGNGCHVWLYDENGEAVEGESNTSGNKITFYIPHFSCYYYESYCY